MIRKLWKFNGKYKADPELAYNEIQSLESITPQAVVDLARDENSVIHNDFEWDNDVAGERYRRIQAQEMIRSFVLVEEPEERKQKSTEFTFSNPNNSMNTGLRALHNTSVKNEYKPTEFFLENKEEYKVLLGKALRELESFKRRYSMIAELEEVFAAINNL